MAIESSKECILLAPAAIQELQRLFSESNVGQADLFSGLVRSVDACSADVKTNNGLMREMLEAVCDLRDSCGKILSSLSDKQQLLEPPRLPQPSHPSVRNKRSLDSIVEEEGSAVCHNSIKDFAPIIQALQEHRSVMNFEPLLDEMRQDFVAMLQGVRESMITVMAGQDANFDKIAAYMDMNRRDSEESCMALFQAIRESKQEGANCRDNENPYLPLWQAICVSRPEVPIDTSGASATLADGTTCVSWPKEPKDDRHGQRGNGWGRGFWCA